MFFGVVIVDKSKVPVKPRSCFKVPDDFFSSIFAFLFSLSLSPSLSFSLSLVGLSEPRWTLHFCGPLICLLLLVFWRRGELRSAAAEALIKSVCPSSLPRSLGLPQKNLFCQGDVSFPCCAKSAFQRHICVEVSLVSGGSLPAKTHLRRGVTRLRRFTARQCWKFATKIK